jgi:mediator of RNA polymerase II transcription subunit 13
MTLASPVLRQVFSAVKKTLKTYSEARILFQFIPEQHILGYMGNPSTNFSDLEVLCTSLYDRIQLPADRYMSRPFFEDGECVRKYFQEPAITLARPLHNKVSFIRASRAPLDVMDRHTFMHIGYQVSPCGKWILSACVDQRGEAHDLGVWLTQTPVEGGESDVEMSKELFLVQKVWEFAVQFAKRANVEWRLVFSKLGSMGESEIEGGIFLTCFLFQKWLIKAITTAWTKYLDAMIATRGGLAIAHISLLSVEPDAPWTFISRSNINVNVSPKQKTPSPKHQNNHPQIFTDITTTFFFLAHRNRFPQSFPLAPADLGLCHSYIPESISAPTSSSTDTEHTTGQYPYPHPLPLLAHSSTTLVCLPATPSPTSISMLHIHLLHVVSPLTSTSMSTADEVYQLHADITRNFHELAVLASARWRLCVNPLLPFHLAAVEAMRIALDRDRDRDGCDGEDV